MKDAGGAHVGVIGETFRLGGGEVATLHDGLGLSEATIKRANELCPGRFWFVGEIPTG
ncbi:MAG: hypothetical protein GWN71_05275 [Gammaproteobacteria bacterium]|nr:hypothetical protein [Gemmatimonadota bacterium]NIU73002.1 hypothetical protein [Gammaproteobacteria bacterium]